MSLTPKHTTSTPPQPKSFAQLGAPLPRSPPNSTSLPDDISEREATELDNYFFAAERTTTQTSAPPTGRLAPLKRWWRRYISLSVPSVACRDHLANERTFLSYFRTSMAFSMTGIVIAQFFRLIQSQSPNPVLGFYAIGKPLACVFQVASLATALVGGHRFWRQQMAMAKGKVWAGGWEIWTQIAMAFLLTLTVFILTVAIDVNISGS